jgi:dipeptidyl aminopeptidase/acylaminoacyl peptidase
LAASGGPIMTGILSGRWHRLVLAFVLLPLLAQPACAAEDKPAAAPAVQPAPAVPPRISTADFSLQSTMTGPVLSPDGLHVAARFSIKGEKVLGVADLTGKTPLKFMGVGKSRDLVRYFWAGNHTLMVSIGSTVPWYDDEGYATRLVAYDIDTQKAHTIDNKIAGLKGDDVLWMDPDGKTMLLAFQSSVYEDPEVWKVDIATNKATIASRGFKDIWDWYADSSGVVRYGFGYLDDHNWQMVYRSNATDKFKIVLKGNDDKDDDSAIDTVVRLSQGSDKGYMLARGTDNPYWAIYEYDFVQHKRGAQVYAAPGSDIDSASSSDDGQRLISAEYTDDHNRIHWFDDKLATVQADLDKAVGSTRQVRVVSHSRDFGMLIVSVSSSFDPGSYYVYQQAEGVMRRIAKMNEKLIISQLAPSKYVHYKTRDGQDLTAYLTLPVGRPDKGLPLIILPHGGPFGIRDDGGFDEEVQFYANRGYAVLQPQFRGSGSFGKVFEDSAKGQWGRAMQDDLDDGMDWLVGQGIVDAKRVCVIGSSYGGYAALWAATRNPERYRCAASFAGISDVTKWLKYSGRSLGSNHRENWRAQLLGDKAFDLKTVSPIYTIDRLKVPVLIAHGEADPRVPFKQSKQYADALTAAGKVHEFYPIPDEVHGFSTAAHEQLWFDKLDAFLAKYNPAG